MDGKKHSSGDCSRLENSDLLSHETVFKRIDNLNYVGRKIRIKDGNIVQVDLEHDEIVNTALSKDVQTMFLPSVHITRRRSKTMISKMSQDDPGKVSKMSSKTAGLIRDEMKIVNVPHCIEELVYNSLDAGAQAIEVRVDLNQNEIRIQVIDDGEGISYENLAQVGERSWTTADTDTKSKYGLAGESLACIRGVSRQLSIVSRAEGGETFVLQFNLGVRGEVKKAPTNRPAPGTTVTLTGVFYRKLAKLGLVQPVSTLHKIRQFLVCLSLHFPEIKFSLRNDTTGKRDFILKTEKQKTSFDRFLSLFGWRTDVLMEKVETLNYSSKYVDITGFISTITSSGSDIQLLTVNHKVANDPFLNEVLKTQLKSMDDKFREKDIKHPIYFISINLKKEGTHWFQYNGNLPRVYFKSKSSVLRHLEKAVQDVLEKAGLLKLGCAEPSFSNLLMTGVKLLPRVPSLDEVSETGLHGSSLKVIRSGVILPKSKEFNYSPDIHGARTSLPCYKPRQSSGSSATSIIIRKQGADKTCRRIAVPVFNRERSKETNLEPVPPRATKEFLNQAIIATPTSTEDDPVDSSVSSSVKRKLFEENCSGSRKRIEMDPETNKNENLETVHPESMLSVRITKSIHLWEACERASRLNFDGFDFEKFLEDENDLDNSQVKKSTDPGVDETVDQDWFGTEGWNLGHETQNNWVSFKPKEDDIVDQGTPMKRTSRVFVCDQEAAKNNLSRHKINLSKNGFISNQAPRLHPSSFTYLSSTTMMRPNSTLRTTHSRPKVPGSVEFCHLAPIPSTGRPVLSAPAPYIPAIKPVLKPLKETISSTPYLQYFDQLEPYSRVQTNQNSAKISNNQEYGRIVQLSEVSPVTLSGTYFETRNQPLVLEYPNDPLEQGSSPTQYPEIRYVPQHDESGGPGAKPSIGNAPRFLRIAPVKSDCTNKNPILTQSKTLIKSLNTGAQKETLRHPRDNGRSMVENFPLNSSRSYGYLSALGNPESENQPMETFVIELEPRCFESRDEFIFPVMSGQDGYSETHHPLPEPDRSGVRVEGSESGVEPVSSLLNLPCFQGYTENSSQAAEPCIIGQDENHIMMTENYHNSTLNETVRSRYFSPQPGQLSSARTRGRVGEQGQNQVRLDY